MSVCEQLSVFAQPATRVVDPAQSRNAARVVAKGSDELERRIAVLVAESRRPMTAEAIAQQITLDSHRWGHSTIESAVTRARKRGLIVPAGLAVTSRGREAQAYASPGGVS